MPKKLRVTMPDGSEWDVPAEIIAKSRADYYCSVDGDADFDKVLKDSLSDDGILIDWAENEMNWEDVEEVATQVTPAEINYQEGWVNGDKEIVES